MIILVRPWFLYKSDVDVVIISRLMLPYTVFMVLFLVASLAGGLLAQRRADIVGFR